MVNTSVIAECSKRNIRRWKVFHQTVDLMLGTMNPDGTQFFSMTSSCTDFSYFLGKVMGLTPDITLPEKILESLPLDRDLWNYLIYGRILLPNVLTLGSEIGDEPELLVSHEIPNSNLIHCIEVFRRVISRQNNRDWARAIQASQEEKVKCQN